MPITVQDIVNSLNNERKLAGLSSFKVDPTLTRIAEIRLGKPADHVGLIQDAQDCGWPIRRVKMRPYWDYNFSECVWDGGRLRLSEKNIESLARGLRITPREQDPYHTDDFRAAWTHVGIAITQCKVDIIYGIR